MKRRTVTESFNCAVEGFIYVIKTQKNMKFHFLVAVLVLLVAIYLQMPIVHIMLLTVATSLVLITEMINTAFEHAIDMFTEDFHPIARIIKDVTAGAVLVSAINAVIVGYLIFQRRLKIDIESGLHKIRESPVHLTFIVMILVLAVVLVAKLLFHKGTPLRGGMPSGHSAVVFSIWAVIVYVSGNGLVAVLSGLMAFLVARSRIREHAHNVWEVLAGAIVGVLITTLIFQLIR